MQFSVALQPGALEGHRHQVGDGADCVTCALGARFLLGGHEQQAYPLVAGNEGRHDRQRRLKTVGQFGQTANHHGALVPGALDGGAAVAVREPRAGVELVDPRRRIGVEGCGPGIDAKKDAGRPASGTNGLAVELRYQIGHPVAGSQ